MKIDLGNTEPTYDPTQFEREFRELCARHNVLGVAVTAYPPVGGMHTALTQTDWALFEERIVGDDERIVIDQNLSEETPDLWMRLALTVGAINAHYTLLNELVAKAEGFLSEVAEIGDFKLEARSLKTDHPMFDKFRKGKEDSADEED